MTNSNKTKFGVSGSLALIVGIFTPVVSMPIVGNLSYLQSTSTLAGGIIALMALISIMAAFGQSYRALIVTGLVSLGWLGVCFWGISQSMQNAGPFAQLAHMEWGWGVLIGAALVLICTGLAGKTKEDGKSLDSEFRPSGSSRPVANFCSNCAAQLDADARFCPSCSAPIF